MTDSARLVGDSRALASLVDAIESEPVIGLDTEFVREQTYYPRLCLIQVATPHRLACVDCLAELDLAPLFDALLAPGRTWILHSARQDLEAMHPLMDGLPAALIDTQIAAALIGKTPQIGLQTLVSDELNVRLEKQFTRTNWAARPLPAGALEYALDDVRHLFALWSALKQRLEELDRLRWLEEDCRIALETPVLTPPHAMWARLRGVRSLDARTRYASLALVEWRERCSQRLNRPRRWICSDDLLLRIARAMPARERDLARIAELPKRMARRFGGEIIAAIAGSDNPETRRLAADRRTPVPEGGIKPLREGARQRALELGIDPQVLATRQELTDLLCGIPGGRVAGGWRQEALKDLV